jgi:hypothetical protein
MTDVFISYKKEDAARVEPIARGLARAGYEVWWDHNIPPGRSYREVIGAQLQTAKCVIVVWSKLSVDGQWVLDEADAGKQRNVLLPMMIDDVDIPYGFRQIEAARLTGWNGDANDHEWTNALGAVAHFVGRPPGGPPKPFVVPAARPAAAAKVATTLPTEKSGGGLGPALIGLVLVALLAGGGYLAWQFGVFGRATETAQTDLAAPDAAVPVATETPTTTPTIGEPGAPVVAPPVATAPGATPLTAPPATTVNLRRVTFQSGGALTREPSGMWAEEDPRTGAPNGFRWREESRDIDTITLRDDGRRARMRVELAENVIYLFFPDWGEFRKQWAIAAREYGAPIAAPAPAPAATTQGLRRVMFQSGGGLVREASGAWVEQNAQTGALDGARWREESRDTDTITLRDAGRDAGMRIELSENAIYLYFPDWGEWRKQWIIGEKQHDQRQ